MALVQAWPTRCLMATWLIHYLSSAYYVSDTIPGARDSAMNKRDTDPFLVEIIS